MDIQLKLVDRKLLQTKKGQFYRYRLSSIGVELEKDRCEGVEMRELNDTEKFTSQVQVLTFQEVVEAQIRQFS